MDQEIRALIIGFFREREKFIGLDDNACAKINFVESGLLDSIEFITLISEIEENFNVIFTEDDLQSTDFSNIEGLVRIATARRKLRFN